MAYETKGITENESTSANKTVTNPNSQSTSPLIEESSTQRQEANASASKIDMSNITDLLTLGGKADQEGSVKDIDCLEYIDNHTVKTEDGVILDLDKGDINYIVKVASRKMFNESIAEKDKPYKTITQVQLEDIITHKSPSVTSKDLREYERIRSQFSPKDSGAKMQQIGFI